MVGQLPLGLWLLSQLPISCRAVPKGPDAVASILAWGRRRDSRASLHTRADSRSPACLRAVYFCASYIFIM